MPDDRRSLDRRVQRTRALLRDALMRLIVREGYDDITIKAITDEANVARTTFYLHFANKDELLFSTLRDLYEDLRTSSHLPTAEDMLAPSLDTVETTDFDHVREYADFYRVMLSERGSAAFLTQVRQYLAEIVAAEIIAQVLPPHQRDQARLPIEMMGYAIAGAQIAVIKWWLDNDMPHDTQEISLMMQQFLSHGLLWNLGYTSPPPQDEG